MSFVTGYNAITSSQPVSAAVGISKAFRHQCRDMGSTVLTQAAGRNLVASQRSSGKSTESCRHVCVCTQVRKHLLGRRKATALRLGRLHSVWLRSKEAVITSGEAGGAGLPGEEGRRRPAHLTRGARGQLRDHEAAAAAGVAECPLPPHDGEAETLRITIWPTVTLFGICNAS